MRNRHLSEVYFYYTYRKLIFPTAKAFNNVFKFTKDSLNRLKYKRLFKKYMSFFLNVTINEIKRSIYHCLETWMRVLVRKEIVH